MNPDRLAELEEERRFLLGSIRDIEREHDAGDVEDSDYAALRDGYVARAAAVLREIEDGTSSLTPKPPRSWARTVAIIAVTAAVAIGLGVFVARSAGQRLPGQSLTGGQDVDEVAVQLAEGRRLLGSDSAASLAAYQRVLELEPGNAEAATYSAYLQVIDGRQSGDQAAVRAGIEQLRVAAEMDPTYGDPHCLLAVAGGNFLDPPDAELVTTEGATCLALNPPQDMLAQVNALIARFDPNATTTTTAELDVDSLLAQADTAQSNGDYATALQVYQQVLQIDSGNLTARSFSGYLIALLGDSTSNADQVEQGLDLLQAVTDEHPEFTLAHCLMTLGEHYWAADPDDALTKSEGEQCLANDPPADIVTYVQDVLADL